MRPILYHHHRSSASWRVRWALGIKGVAFEAIDVDLRAGAQRSAEHLARNPIGHVPVLVIDGKSLAESVAILEHLEATIPTPPLYPSDPWGRARVRQLIETINAGIQPLQNLIVLERHSADPQEQARWGHFFNQRGLLAYEALLGEIARERGEDGPFSFGAALTAADLFLVPQVASARRFGVDLAAMPRVVAAERAALATPHAAAAHPDAQPR